MKQGRLSIYLFVFVILAGAGLLFYWCKAEMKKVRSEPISAWHEDHYGDCAVVLTGGPGRVREGIDLLVRGQVKKLIISGVHPQSSLYEIFPEWPFYFSLNPEDVVLERQSATTYGNAVQSFVLAEALNCYNLVLVTSQPHMYRSYRSFRNAFPPEYRIIKHAIPQGGRQTEVGEFVIEAVKSAFYSLWAY